MNAKVKFTGKLVISTTIFVVIFYIIGWSEIIQALAKVEWPWLLSMYCFLLLKQAIDSYQLHFILRKCDIKVAIWRIFLASQLGTLYSLMLPGEIASSAAKWSNLSSATGKKSLILNAMVYNKFLFTILPLAVGCIAIIIDNPMNNILIPILALAALLLLLLCMLLLYHHKLGLITDHYLRLALELLPEKISSKCTYILDTIKPIRSFRTRDHLLVLLISATGYCIGILHFYCIVRTLGPQLSIVSAAWMFSLLELLILLPITIANLGIRESALIYTLKPFGVQPEVSVAIGLIAFTNVILMALIGAVYQIVLIFRFKK